MGPSNYLVCLTFLLCVNTRGGELFGTLGSVMCEPVALSLAFLPPSPHAQGCTPERERVLVDKSTRVQLKLYVHNPVEVVGPGSDDPASHPVPDTVSQDSKM